MCRQVTVELSNIIVQIHALDALFNESCFHMLLQISQECQTRSKCVTEKKGNAVERLDVGTLVI